MGRLGRASSKVLRGALFAPACLFASEAWAQSCSATVDNIAFGDVGNAQVDSTANVSVTCTNPGNLSVLTPVMVCINLGNGGGGLNGANRAMASGANKLSYQLYSNSGRTTVIGTGTSAVRLDVSIPGILGGTATQNATIYARFPAGQTSAPAGYYQSLFAPGSDAVLRYAVTLLGLGTCGQSGMITGPTHPSFTVTARKQVSCSVSANAVDFGSKGDLNAIADATGSLAVTCTPNLPYQISLGSGQNGSTATTRRMKSGVNYVNYGLFTDASRAQVWGDQIGMNTASQTGTGSAQNITVYGRVPVQTTPPPGTYQDTVVVTVTY